jgi:ribosomal protein S6--L-glutamate ligase
MKTASDKFWTSQNLSEAGLPQPKTILTNIPRHAGFLIEKVGGLPTVGKATRGSQGKAVFIMETPLAANTTLQTFLNGKAESIIIQQFIESSANNKAVHDIRAIVVGDRVVSAMERTGTNGLHANLSQGGTGRDVLSELTDREKELCVKAAKAVHLDFAGVDFIRNANDATKSFWIEVNSNSGEGIIGITGKNHYEDLLKLIADRTTKNISETATGAKSTTLTGEQMVNMAKEGDQSREVLTGAVAYLSKQNSHSPDEYAMLNIFRRGLNKLTGGW